MTGKKQAKKTIPNYDHLFSEEGSKGKKKSGFLKKIIKLNLGKIILTTLIYIIQASPLWVVPLLTSEIINIVTQGLNDKAVQTIIIDALIMLILFLQNVPTTMLRSKILYGMVRRTSAGIKSAVVRKLQHLSITYHKDMASGRLQAKFLKDTDNIELLLLRVFDSVITVGIGVIISIGISIYKSGIVSLFFLFVIPFNVALSFFFRKKIRATNRQYRNKVENMSVKMANMLDMLMVTKSHGLEESEISSVNEDIEQVVGSGLTLDSTNAHFGAWVWVLNNALSGLSLVFCGFLALYNIIKVGDIYLYQSMFSSISGGISALIAIVPQIGTGLEAVSSISEIMNSSDIEVNLGKGVVPNIKGNIEFQNVSYKYPNTDNYVIKDLSFKVKAGECIAVVGASGSGKTTIMNLIIGFLTPDEGNILIDGKNLSQFNLSEYRHNISVVPQNSILFSGSIKENITYGLPTYKEEALSEAIEKANIKELIETLPQGIETKIGEHGGKLSGGQKQRITIARALIRNPKIFILDEATSALDNISEFHVQKAISSSIKGRTTFIVAHRLSTIRDADRIIVMDEGRCVEVGTYDELMDKKGKFYELKNLNDLNTNKSIEVL